MLSPVPAATTVPSRSTVAAEAAGRSDADVVAGAGVAGAGVAGAGAAGAARDAGAGAARDAGAGAAGVAGDAAAGAATISAGAATLGRPTGWPRAAVAMPGSHSPAAGEKYPVPDASPRSVTGSPPPSRQVSQSCGSSTAATRAALAGSCSASQRSFVTVNDAVGTLPVRCAHHDGPPSSPISSAAAAADRRSFQSRAGLITWPAPSSTIMPCCWPATPTAAARSSRPAPPAARPPTRRPGHIRSRPDAARCRGRPRSRRRRRRAAPWSTESSNQRPLRACRSFLSQPNGRLADERQEPPLSQVMRFGQSCR